MKLLEELYARNRFAVGRHDASGTRDLLRELGNPDHTFDSIQIAGSNGKGSLATKVARSLEASGKRVGLFTSPHIERFSERIVVDGEEIPEADLERLLSFLLERAEGLPFTFFDLALVLALLYFKEQKVEVALLEVGLGGRLDATMAVDPILTAITSISLEHTEILGDTIEEIAWEKGGIIRKNVPVIIGPTVPISVIGPMAQEREAALTVVNGVFVSYEEENRALAKALCRELEVEPAGLEIRPPCRMEEVQPGVIFDVAHNPEGIRKMLESVRLLDRGREIHVVAGFSGEKDVTACAVLLRKECARVRFVAFEHPRAYQGELLEGSVEQLLPEAQQVAEREGAWLVVCGSVYLMESAKRFLSLPCSKLSADF